MRVSGWGVFEEAAAGRDSGHRRCLGPAVAGSWMLLPLLAAVVLSLMVGCGGTVNGITSISAAAANLDAGQSMTITATVVGSHPLNWNLAGTGCSGASCGTLSATTGTSVIYTAPATVASQFTATLTAQVAGTNNLRTVNLQVNAAPAIKSALPAGTQGVPYTATVAVIGGVAPYHLSLGSGTLPAGLSLNAANATISGTPTAAGVSNFALQIQDASDIASSVSVPASITIAPPPPPALSVSSPSLPAGSTGLPYHASIPVAGGIAPYACTIASGSLPAGLALASNCAVTGVPTVAGSATATISVADSESPAQSIAVNVAITIQQTPALTIVAGILPQATAGTAYNTALNVSGGNAPETCSVASGSLPAGLALSADCHVAGTPTATGVFTFTASVTDSSSPAQVKSSAASLVVVAPASLTLLAPQAATVGVPYSATVAVSGGTAPYQCTVTSGTLPAGLVLLPGCQISGTAPSAGTASITLQASDSASPAHIGSLNFSMQVKPAASAISIVAPLAAQVGVLYNSLLGITGGTAPYACSVVGGALPAGISLGPNCALSGTASVAGRSTAQVSVTDSSVPANSLTTNLTLAVDALQPLSLSSGLTVSTLNQPFSQVLQASGGVGPYTYAVTSGALPAGLTLSSNGTLSGTVGAVGAATFTVTATDSQATPQTVAKQLLLQTVYPTNAQSALLNGPYAFLFQGFDEVTSGAAAYQTATVGGIFADGTGVITAGEQDSNHQALSIAGNTVAKESVVGSYTIGADLRGTLALTPLHADGSAGSTVLYSFALKAPAQGSAIATAASLIEADGDGAIGSKGSGILTAQTPTAFLNGLTGSYAYGLWGDTPCFASCAGGIDAGPVATVGQIVASGGALTGMSDTVIGSASTASSALTGSYGFADNRGRMAMTLSSAKLTGTPFPADFVAYIVDSSHLLLLSTDKHASYILQAGTAQLQSVASFANSSLNSGYVGYENSLVSPDLLATTLDHVLGLGTATVFRGAADGNGSCNTTAVDMAGTNGVAHALNGLVDIGLISALDGSYQALGSSSCTVESNGRTTLQYAEQGVVQLLNLASLNLPIKPAPRIAYLTGPNQGYFLETGYAALGRIESQGGAPFSTANLLGSFVESSLPAATLGAPTTAGVLTADGAGNLAWTADLNLSAGNANLLNLNLTGSSTYNSTDPVSGRFQLSSGEVIYAITPQRFLLLEPGSTGNAASVSLLY